MHEGHSSRGKLKLQFLTKRRVASAIDKVVNFIKHDKAIKLVAIGDQSRSFNLPGASNGGPIKRIERRAVVRGRNEGFQVMLVNERCTSAKSWCCKGYQMQGMKDGNKGGVTYGIQVCQGCGKLWGRDHYASFNISDCVHAEVNGLVRPAHLFSRLPGPFPAAAAAAAHAAADDDDAV
jgi:hypothetical protein